MYISVPRESYRSCRNIRHCLVFWRRIVSEIVRRFTKIWYLCSHPCASANLKGNLDKIAYVPVPLLNLSWRSRGCIFHCLAFWGHPQKYNRL